MSHSITAFTPYLYFEGNCEEALNFYSKILDGKLNIEGRYDNPAMQAPKAYHDKIMHATLEFDGHMMMACDILPDANFSTKTGNVALSISVKEVEVGKNIFEQLSKGGTVNYAFEKQFWGDWHGNFTDRFGISWMINAPSA